ncbi:MAG: HAD-IA family hydrolase, partial [Acaryochloridaceae cyanobacterium CSU_5_19]|nr:HAD-IA family hydrolase [Acaryochloridaceae cyanobacterium CSU_5_19]
RDYPRGDFNFDSRLYAVLETLNLSQYFTSVTISTVAGVAKPDAQLFKTALAKHDCPAKAAWHIGDSWQDDYEGANQAGLRGIWLNRDQQLPPSPAKVEIADLLGLALPSP